MTEKKLIQPGDRVERTGSYLDDRTVVRVGPGWLTLDILGEESPPLPLENYRVVTSAKEGA